MGQKRRMFWHACVRAEREHLAGAGYDDILHPVRTGE